MSPGDTYKTEVINDTLVIQFEHPTNLDDSHVPVCQEELEDMVATSDTLRILLDLSNVDYMCSTALGMLAALHKQAVELSRSFELCSPQPQIQEVLEITMFHKLLPIHASIEVATAVQ